MLLFFRVTVPLWWKAATATLQFAAAAAAESGGSEDLSFPPGYALSSLLVRGSERTGGREDAGDRDRRDLPSFCAARARASIIVASRDAS